MGDRRKPDTVLLVRNGDRTMKIELFPGRFFPIGRFDNVEGDPIPQHTLHHYYRLRVDGIWYPGGLRRMYSQNQCLDLIKKEVFYEAQ